MIQITPVEDLSREHGLLRRLLRIYRNTAYRAGLLCAARVLHVASEAADIAKRFIEEYHQALEETYVFPEIAENTSLVPLISALKRQHTAAKHATTEIQALFCRPRTAVNKRLARLFKLYAEMYDQHPAREDTVVFPVFPKIAELTKYDALGNT